MRPADDEDSDGPQNMAFALKQAEQLGAGVWVAFAGRLFSGGNVRKAHPTRLDAFDVIDEASVAASPAPLIALKLPIQRWPSVEVVMSYAGTDGVVVNALIAQKVDGIVVVGTGNCTVHDVLKAKLDKALEAGIAVILTTRCSAGWVIQERIDLMLRLMR